MELPVLLVLAYRPPELLRQQAPRVEGLTHFAEAHGSALARLAEATRERAVPRKSTEPSRGATNLPNSVLD